MSTLCNRPPPCPSSSSSTVGNEIDSERGRRTRRRTRRIVLAPWCAPRPSVQALVILFCLFLGSLAAQEAKVRTSLATTGDLWVGQKVVVVVEVLAPGYFASAVSFDLPDP